METAKITIKELRDILYEVANQEMPVRELRKKLFDEKNQYENLEVKKLRAF